MENVFLTKPSEAYFDEIRAYRQEFFDDGGNSHGDGGLKLFDDLHEWLKISRLSEHKETLPNPDWVEAEQFMLVREGDSRVLGMIHFRHYLNEALAISGGHIGYGVRPSERRRGYAAKMLSLCLEKCRERGLDKVLLTCDAINEASRRTILSCGGVFESEILDGGKRKERYWITI